MPTSPNVATMPHAFVATLEGAGSSIRLPISGSTFSIGREAGNDLCVPDDSSVSRHHCTIHAIGSALMVEDTSRNGTFVGDERVVGIAPLPVPSVLVVGQTRLGIEPATAQGAIATSVVQSPYAGEELIGLSATGMLRIRTDAFLVVDIVGSSKLVRTDSSLFTKLILAMGRILERAVRDEIAPFMKCTGDGFFVCFATPQAALEASLELAKSLPSLVRVKFQLSMALHWGVCYLTEQGDRIGNNAHAVFALEQVRHQDPALEEELRSQGTPWLLLMTEPFYLELGDEDRRQTRPLGSYTLKGLDQPVPVHRWVELSSDKRGDGRGPR